MLTPLPVRIRGATVCRLLMPLADAAVAPTVKQQFAAVRMLFDWLASGHIVEVNPASSVRGPKHVVKHGKIPVLTADQARTLLDSIKIKKKLGEPSLVGLGDSRCQALQSNCSLISANHHSPSRPACQHRWVPAPLLGSPHRPAPGSGIAGCADGPHAAPAPGMRDPRLFPIERRCTAFASPRRLRE